MNIYCGIYAQTNFRRTTEKKKKNWNINSAHQNLIMRWNLVQCPHRARIGSREREFLLKNRTKFFDLRAP